MITLVDNRERKNNINVTKDLTQSHMKLVSEFGKVQDRLKEDISDLKNTTEEKITNGNMWLQRDL